MKLWTVICVRSSRCYASKVCVLEFKGKYSCESVLAQCALYQLDRSCSTLKIMERRDSEVQCSDSRIELEMALGFAQTRARQAEETLSQFDSRLESAVLKLIACLSSREPQLELSPACLTPQNTPHVAPESEAESPRGELIIPASESILFHAEQSLRLGVSQHRISLLREIEQVIGPILEWRHRAWPEDASYAFISNTFSESVIGGGPTSPVTNTVSGAGVFGVIARAVEAERRAATLAIDCDVATRRAGRAEQRLSTLENDLSELRDQLQQRDDQLSTARQVAFLHSYQYGHTLSRQRGRQAAGLYDAVVLCIRVQARRARCCAHYYLSCVLGWLVGLYSRVTQSTWLL
eukprot:TRINITY_DN1403_c0_g1_i1.p1 TRINITY_DN1403_c0_g1~~TRINITY_DN1403_c0_g1_i1.p1  ORF type:complete len:350 (+),score=34.30 TRINITY_DN1403_c0_g1_i1:29-1078(+)